MKNFSFVDFKKGQLSNPDVFALILFNALDLTFQAMGVLDLSMGDKVIIAKDLNGDYYLGKANSRFDPEAWPVNFSRIDTAEHQHESMPSIAVKLTGSSVKGFDQNGTIKLFKLETA